MRRDKYVNKNKKKYIIWANNQTVKHLELNIKIMRSLWTFVGLNCSIVAAYLEFYTDFEYPVMLFLLGIILFFRGFCLGTRKEELDTGAVALDCGVYAVVSISLVIVFEFWQLIFICLLEICYILYVTHRYFEMNKKTRKKNEK